MGTSPDQIAAEIVDTRTELAEDVDRLVDRTSPARIARRRTERMRSAMAGAREKVMGRAEQAAGTTRSKAGQAAGSTRETAGQLTEAVQSAPQQAMERTQGSPLAAGLIAFGGGMLAAYLLPASQPEQRAGQQLKEQGSELVQPVKQAVTESAREVADDLQPRARQAATEVKEAAKGAAKQTRQEAKGQAQKVAGKVRESGQAVTDSRDG